MELVSKMKPRIETGLGPQLNPDLAVELVRDTSVLPCLVVRGVPGKRDL